ncbi:MAG TPA: 50S ribosomal protein L25 [Ktedonobacterales bacterium]
MPEQITLRVQPRTIFGKQVRRLRREGWLPANISGGHAESVAIQVEAHELERMLKAHGRTTLFRLTGLSKGSGGMALIRHVQRTPTGTAIQHVDFLKVNMSEPLRARIPVHVTGEAPAVKLQDGVLMHTLDAVEVEALPGDLPEAVTVDVSKLAEVNSSVLARDVTLPAKVKLLTEPSEPVITIAAPRVVPAEVAAPEAVRPLPAEEAGESAQPSA